MLHPLRRRWRWIPVCAAVGLIAASCGGGGTEGASSDTTATSIAESPTSTTVVTDVTEQTRSTVTSTTEATTTTQPSESGPVAPLTGMPVDEAVNRPALVIKIDNNDQDARPQWGLNQADVVFEEIVEARVTRFAAVFHSTDADPVGPVRSARTSDFDLLTNLNTPLFANSGGNNGVLSRLRNVDTVNVNVNVLTELYYREGSRRRPSNLLTNTSEIFANAPDGAGLPPALFQYRGDGESVPFGRPVDGVTIAFGNLTAEYRWSTERGGWERSQNGTLHVDADGVQVAPPNVVVQFVGYGRSPAFAGSPEAILVGEGDAWIFTDGQLVTGRWSRPDRTDVTSFTTVDGVPIELTPGPTWVVLPRVGQAEIIE